MRFKPEGSRELKHYAFVVITATPADFRHPTSSSHQFDQVYRKGQILVCQLLGGVGGIPQEVGTGIKPGKLNYVYERFDVMPEAIEFSYMLTEEGFDHRGRGKQKNTWQGKGKKKKRKFRHRA